MSDVPPLPPPPDGPSLLPLPPEQAPAPPEAPGDFLDARRLERRRVGRLLAATAWAGILLQPLSLLASAIQLMAIREGTAPGDQLWAGISYTAAGVLGLVVAIYTLRAARRLREEGDTRSARLAALFVAFPCSSPCCLLGTPVGIWALLALREHD